MNNRLAKLEQVFLEEVNGFYSKNKRIIKPKKVIRMSFISRKIGKLVFTGKVPRVSSTKAFTMLCNVCMPSIAIVVGIEQVKYKLLHIFKVKRNALFISVQSKYGAFYHLSALTKRNKLKKRRVIYHGKDDIRLTGNKYYEP